MRWIILTATHLATLAFGFALGIYYLPILTAPPGPTKAEVEAATRLVEFKGRFERNLKGSDPIHWGEGEVMVGRSQIVHVGRLAPGPDYKLYLVKGFVDTKDGFLKVKKDARMIADIKTFEGFIATVPSGTDIAAYDTVLVWCEAFSQFITAAKYR
jgi:hypothetical protein